MNITGTPLATSAIGGSGAYGGGRELADKYALSFAYSAGNWDITVTPDHAEPYVVTLPHPLGTDQGGIVPGVVLTFDTLNILLSYAAEVHVGYHAGTVVAGALSDTKQLWAKNTGPDDGLDARIQIRPDANFENVVESPVKALHEDSLATSAAIGTFTITQLAGTPLTYAVEFDGTPLGDFEVQGSDPALYLELPDGPTVLFDTLTSLDTDDQATITVNPGFQRVELAPDVAGAPGTFAAADLVLGAMDAGDIEPFWVRIAPGDEDPAAGNPYQAQLQARITSV